MMKRKLIYIASPYAGEVERNVELAKQYCRYVMDFGYDFIAVHLLYPQVLNDEDKLERERGILMGLRLLSVCEELWCFGDRVTEGMNCEIREAKRLGMKVVYISSTEIQGKMNEKRLPSIGMSIS
jgi:hypothetical protein